MATEAEYKRWCGWLDAINERGVNLTEWEEQFRDSMNEKFDRHKTNVRMTFSQTEQLERIYTDRVP